MDKPRRNSGGRSTGRGSDKNSKDTSPKPGRASAPRGKSDGKFDKKPFDKGDKKPYGRTAGSDPRKSAGKPFGDKKFGKADERTPKPYGDKGKFGDKKFDRPSKPYGDKGKFADKNPADRPGRDADKKSSYKSYEEKGKRGSRSGEFDASKIWGNDAKADKKEFAPKKAKTGKAKPEPAENKAQNHENLADTKKSGKKPRIKRETKPKADVPEYEKSAFPQLGIRLNKFIANSGMCSRREADVMIQNGVVTVNGKVMDELGYRVQADDVVKFDGRTIIPERPVYLLLNKPKDYITTSEDPQGRKTVMALIQGACKERLFPVGRLDRNTTGLLLFTNDGEMADKLMHPRKRVKKIYLAELDKNMKHEHLQELREGITLEDGPIKPDEVEYADDKRTIGVEIHSGRNRIVRRMFEHFGYKVVKLDRTYYAGLTKKNLPRGHYRMLEPLEVNMLKML